MYELRWSRAFSQPRTAGRLLRATLATLGLPPEQPSDDGALVPSACNELHALHVESLSPLRLVFENRLEHRFGLGRRVEELKT